MQNIVLLLRFPSVPNTTSPVDFISNVGWGAIKTLSEMEKFRGLDKDIEAQSKRWQSFVDAELPEKEKFPYGWKKKSALQKLCMMRFKFIFEKSKMEPYFQDAST